MRTYHSTTTNKAHVEISVQEFCGWIALGAEKWLASIAPDTAKQAALLDLLRIHDMTETGRDR